MGSTLNFIKRNGRSGFRSAKRYSSSKTYSSFSNNKSRPKGNVENLYYKYIKLAKESSAAGDRIQAEYYYQFADHYARLMIEQDIKSVESHETSDEVNEQMSQENFSDIKDEPSKDSLDIKDDSTNPKENALLENLDDEDSIESVPFIGQLSKTNLKSKKSK